MRLRNAFAPVRTVTAKVAAKREKASARTLQGRNHVRFMDYYAEFELTDGNRMELRVGDAAYRLLVEGAEGTLTVQGTRFEGFAARVG